ncbi:MAG: long-chain-fatty-acid--CoA ligase [Burkholderiales bacterium]|nr:long-chain-fatty-acid--CoA ligase [Burkholderiales bacterium]
MRLTQALHRSLQQQPLATATVFQGRRHSFIQFHERVARLAAALRQLGLKDFDRVGMLALNSDRYLEYYQACFWAGLTVNPCNIRWSAAEVAYSLDDCDTRVLIVDDTFKAMGAELKKQSKALQTVIYAGDGATPAGMLAYETILAAATPMEDNCGSDGDLAGIFYTGGTTGFPKGVMLTHASIHASAMAIAADAIGYDAILLHAAPMFHAADFALSMAQCIRGGAHTFVPAFNPAGVLETIQAERVTHTIWVPTMVQMVADFPEIKNYDVSSLQTIVYGASPMNERVLERAMQALPGAGFIQAYGMTELSPVASILPPYHHTEEGRKSGKMRSAGRTALCSRIKIVDEEGAEVPRGTVGEVIVQGANVMKGYWNKPAETAAAVRDGWMHTGDGGYMDEDGFIFIMDRMKDMIISGGENVYSSEVENAITQHPAVAASAVIGIPDEKWGELVHAVVVRKAGAEVSDAELIAHCKQRIAGYKCPRSVAFVAALPVSGAGKILKKDLREPYWRDRQRRVN